MKSQSKMKFGFWNMLMERGAVFTARRRAGLDEALTIRKLALSGIENRLHGCHSNAVIAVSPLRQTSVLPRPSRTM